MSDISENEITGKTPARMDVDSGSAANIASNGRQEGSISPDKTPGATRREFLSAAGIAGAVLLFGLPLVRAQAKSSVKVGFILPEKGPLADEAKSLFTGFDLYLKERQGEGPTLEKVVQDPGEDEGRTLEALADLAINQTVQFIIGPLSLEAAEKSIHGVRGSEVILFVTNPSVRFVSGELCLPGSFRLGANTYQASRPLATWAVEDGLSKVFLTGSDDYLGNELTDFFNRGLERSGGRFADRMMLSSVASGMDELIGRIRETKADSVFAAFRDDEAALFLEMIRKADPPLSVKVIGPESLVRFPSALEKLGKIAFGAPTLTNIKSTTGLAAKVKRELGASFTHAERVAEGYDLAQVICRAISGPQGKDLNQKAMIDRIGQLEIEGPRGKVSFDKNHEPILESRVQEWNGEGDSFKERIIAELGECKSLDFGCGRVGFQKRAETPENEIELESDSEPPVEEE